MVTKLSAVAMLQSGIVLSRKEATSEGESFEYKRLNLRAINETGHVVSPELETFYTQEELSFSQLTQDGDIVVRLFAPLFPTLITEEDVGLVVPSQLALIRLRDPTVLPAYLQICLSRQSIAETLLSKEIGVHRSITVKALSDLSIPLVPIGIQKKAIEICDLAKRRKQLYQELVEQEQLQTESLIESMIGGFQNEQKDNQKRY